MLAESLLLCFRLQESKIGAVSSTAAATLRQLTMFVFDAVVEEDIALEHGGVDSTTLPTGFSVTVPPSSPSEELINVDLYPAARDGYFVFSDLCSLVNGDGEEAEFIKLSSLPKTFGLELLESILTNYGSLFKKHRELLFLLRSHLCPLLIRLLSLPSSSTDKSYTFALTLRLMRVIFILLKQFSGELQVEAEMFLRMFIRVIQPGENNAVDGSGGHPIGSSEGGGIGSSPAWLRILTLEIFRALCIDFELMKKIYERYDYDESQGYSLNANEENLPAKPAPIFQSLLTSFHRLASERPAILGTGTQVLYGTSNGPIPAHSASTAGSSIGGVTGAAVDVLGGVMEIATQAATAAATTVTTGTAAEKPGLSMSNSQVKVQCIDQLDKAEAPGMPDTYVFYLATQCITSIAEGFAQFALPTYSSIIASRARRTSGDSGEVSASTSNKAPPALELDSLPPEDPRTRELKLVMNMANAGWPAILASLSFFMTTNLDDHLFFEVLQSLQNFCNVCGVLNLITPRDAFLTSICRFAVPHAIVSYVASLESAPAKAASVLSVDALGLGPGPAGPIGLSQRNFATLKSLLAVAQYLAGSLNNTWFSVFETLQNADQVIRTNSARSKAMKRTGTGSSVPARQTTTMPASPTSGSLAIKNATPSEVEEQAMQASISRLFETSRNLDDSAFRWFLGALCRLSGEMVGFQMNEDGSQYLEDHLSTGAKSPTDASTEELSSTALTSASSMRRRISGLNTVKAMKAGERSFAISKLGSVSMLNGHRMVYRDANVGWDIATCHLLSVQHYSQASSDVRLQAGEVLDKILVAASKNVANAPEDLRRRIQTQILQAIHDQAEPPHLSQTSTDFEIRRMALETMFNILETNGESFIAGWEKIFNILSMACPPPSAHSFRQHREKEKQVDIPENDEAPPIRGRTLSTVSLSSTTASGTSSSKSSVLVRTSFPSLQLICTEFLGVLTVSELKLCVSTLSDFGKQGDDVNVALTAGGLLWQVADHLQVEKNKSIDDKHGYERLWMFLLHQLGQMCQDSRQEVRDGAMQTLFRTVSMYGGTLNEQSWEECLFDIIFPLLDGVTEAVSMVTEEVAVQVVPSTLPMVAQAGGRPIPLVAKQWDDSKTLALTSICQLIDDFLLSKLIRSSRFSAIWDSFVAQTKKSFIADRSPVATASMKGFGKILTIQPSEAADKDVLALAWTTAWEALAEIGEMIVPAHKGDELRYSQLQLEAFVQSIQSLQSSVVFSFDLSRIKRLLVILKATLTHTRSLDYRPDVDSLSPVQSSVLESVEHIDLSVPEAASAVLTDLAEYMSLAYIAPFDASIAEGRNSSMHISYVCLSKKVMPKVVHLFEQHRSDLAVFQDGALERLYSAFSIPLRLKYDCPSPSKFGNDPPLWKTATICFLQVVKVSLPALARLDNVPTETFQGIWRQLIESFRGAILADCHAVTTLPLSQQQEEENFDLCLLASLERDVFPFIHNPLVPPVVIQRLGDCLQESSRLYTLESPMTAIDSASSDEDLEPRKESRFDRNVYHQVQGDIFGTTRDVSPRPRERFEYWCFDLLFFMCSAKRKDGEEIDLLARRTAALILPSLISRAALTIRTYIADVALQGRMPMNRLREEELLYTLRCLLSLKLEEGTYSTAFASTDDSSDGVVKEKETFAQRLKLNVAANLSTSTRAHMYYFYPHFCEILESHETDLSLAPPPAVVVPYRLTKKLVVSDGFLPKGFPKDVTTPGLIGRPWPLEAERNRGGSGLDNLGSKELIIECLRLIGKEIGLGLRL
ncbi:hypothetical protein BT69DRAFT_1345966 [Atractiella rhizophila]|nr:hypothetical protein BT69DRAFT_1345966 [Atractiella rhizophila]